MTWDHLKNLNRKSFGSKSHTFLNRTYCFKLKYSIVGNLIAYVNTKLIMVRFGLHTFILALKVTKPYIAVTP